MGFGVPVGNWMRGDLRSWMEDLLLSRERSAGYFQPEALRQVVDRLEGREDRSFELWPCSGSSSGTRSSWIERHPGGQGAPVIARLNVGGPAIHVINLTRGLDATRFDTTLVTGTENPARAPCWTSPSSKG